MKDIELPETRSFGISASKDGLKIESEALELERAERERLAEISRQDQERADSLKAEQVRVEQMRAEAILEIDQVPELTQSDKLELNVENEQLGQTITVREALEGSIADVSDRSPAGQPLAPPRPSTAQQAEWNGSSYRTTEQYRRGEDTDSLRKRESFVQSVGLSR